MLQCLAHLPALYSHLSCVHLKCKKAEEQCVVCALQAFIAKYSHYRTQANFPVAADGGAVRILDDAVRHCAAGHPTFGEMIDEAAQGDPHEFLTFLISQLEAAEHNRSKKLEKLVKVKQTIAWTCDDCETRRVIDDVTSGLQVGIEQGSSSFEPSLMGYLRMQAQDPLDSRCSSDACQANSRPSKWRQPTRRISSAPSILFIQIKRKQTKRDMHGVWRVFKVNDDVPYPEQLDLSGLTVDGIQLRYRLYGVVGHRGSAEQGHYISAVRQRNEAEFSTINDDMVQSNLGGSVEQLLDPTSLEKRFGTVILAYTKI